MKRQLDSKYSELVNYINERKGNFEIMKLCEDIFDETDIWDKDTPGFPRSKEYKMIFPIYNGDFDWPDRDKLVPIIVDIYNNNYELEEPKYYWKFKELTSNFDNSLYLSTRGAYEGSKLDKNSVGLLTSQSYRIMKFTKSKVIEFLNNSTNLTIDNFTPVEDLD
ncbi:hypothetical protein DWV12_17595 [Clostridium botulinum]|nr:hypothetical protein [Clostridium botulinum]